MDAWRARAAWLMKGFQAPGKHTHVLLQQILEFLNGDTQSPTITHWCLACTESGKPCCQDDSDALNKALAMLTPFVSKGYAVPLLYRMKHYGPAASFIRVACCLHNILPRVLAMDKQTAKSADRPGSELGNIIDTLLAEKPGKTVEGLSETDVATGE